MLILSPDELHAELAHSTLLRRCIVLGVNCPLCAAKLYNKHPAIHQFS